VLGAKKVPKLGAKKIGGAELIDFDEAERKAKEEAERIEKLGYDAEAEKAEADAKAKSAATGATPIAAPTPLSPNRATRNSQERNSSDVERLGMGLGRLGFGQTVSVKPAAPKKLGFGSVAPARSAADGEFIVVVSRSTVSAYISYRGGTQPNQV
jgi:ADP-ribosylation factor GTPase-activating protein 2/3